MPGEWRERRADPALINIHVKRVSPLEANLSHALESRTLNKEFRCLVPSLRSQTAGLTIPVLQDTYLHHKVNAARPSQARQFPAQTSGVIPHGRRDSIVREHHARELPLRVAAAPQYSNSRGVTLMPTAGESFIRSANSRVSIFIIRFPMCATRVMDGEAGPTREQNFFDVACTGRDFLVSSRGRRGRGERGRKEGWKKEGGKSRGERKTKRIGENAGSGTISTPWDLLF